jgi:hypothetical protein
MNIFTNLLVGGIPLMIVIFGLIEFSKSLGMAGKKLTVFSLLLGLIFGMAYQIASAGLPLLFMAWRWDLSPAASMTLQTAGYQK